MRTRLKAAVEAGLVRTGVAHLWRRRFRDDLLILAYHNIVPRGERGAGDRSLHLSEDAFAAQLDLLCQTHEIVPLAEALGVAGSADGRRPRAVVTFDDAYRGAVTAGVRHLAARGIPATIFVAPAFVGGRDFWWDALTQPDEDGLPTEMRTMALDEHRGDDTAVRRWAATVGRREHPVPDHARAATEEELREARRSGLVTLASHSWSHRNLARLDDREAREELERPLAWLRERFDGVAPYLSYPYGLASPHTERLAAAAGYRAALRVDGGWTPARPANVFSLPRLNVPAGMSATGFALRASGIWCR